jgi:uncharacterized protein DUF3987/bifunctional DNA primase/polymerase-like protein/primase-like protein
MTLRLPEASLLDVALALLEKGFHIFPLGSYGEPAPEYFVRDRYDGDQAKADAQWPKTPRVAWKVYQTAPPSEATVRQWWTQWPTANIGIACGKLIAVDADSAASVEWCKKSLPHTPWRVTTGKGMHFYYQKNTLVEVRNSVDENAKLDTRGFGGYVVAAGSRHPNGNYYTDQIDSGSGDLLPHDLPMLDTAAVQSIVTYRNGNIARTLLPGTVAATFSGKGNLAGFDASKVHIPADGSPVAPGGRNNAAASLAGKSFNQGLSMRDTKALLDSWNATNPSPLSDSELNTTIGSVARTHEANHPDRPIPLEAPPPPEPHHVDPVDLWGRVIAPVATAEFFPRVVSEYAFEIADVSGFDPGFVAMAAMVALAGAIHDGINIQCKRNDPTFLQSARLWVALVGLPSAKKSPIMKKVFGQLFKIEGVLREQYGKDMAKYERELLKWKAECKKAEKNDKELPTAPCAPTLVRLVVDDTTVERLQMVLAQNPRGVIQIRDELSGWFASMGAYGDRGSAGKDEAHWLQLHEGGPRLFDRVGRADLFVENWSASVIGGIQPDTIKRIAHKLPNNGLMQRLIPVIGQRRQAIDRHIDMRPVQAFGSMLEGLYRLLPAEAPVTMGQEADDVRKRVFDSLGALMTNFENGRVRLSSHIGKWEGIYCRLALIAHCVDCVERKVHPTHEEVSPESAELAERLMFRYLLPHLMCFYDDVLEEGGENADLMGDVQKVGEHILTKEWANFTDRDITLAVKRWRYRNVREKADRYATLTAMGWIVPETPLDQRGIAARYVVTPAVHTTFADRSVRFGEAMKVVADLLKPSATQGSGKC